jgi:tetratricopeptide (TPR) repeat protein
LVATRQRNEIEMLLDDAGDPDSEALCRYHLSVALALEGDAIGALEQARMALANTSENENLRRLTFKLLLCEATRQSNQQNWSALTDVLTEAVRIAPSDGNAQEELDRFVHALPIAYLRAGERSDACELWEQSLQERPDDLRALHSLALLHYWWAAHDEANPPEGAVPPWEAAIAYWTAVATSDSFWRDWQARRERTWGVTVETEEFSSFRANLLEECLHRLFQDRASDYRAQNRERDAQRFEMYLVMALHELRSAECWRRVQTSLESASESTRSSESLLLSVAGGYLFFKRFNLLTEIRRAADVLTAAKPDDPIVADLRILFSPAGLGLISVLIEERGKYDGALAMLDQLPPTMLADPEVVLLRTRALMLKGQELLDRGQFDGALAAWQDSFARALEARTAPTTPHAFEVLFAFRMQELQAAAVKAAQREATRLKNEGQLDQGIVILERARNLDHDDVLRDHVCILYCDRGSQKLSKDRYEEARADFNRALALNPAYTRAKSGMSASYNNEAVAKTNPSAQIPLFEQALRFDPNNETAKKNFANAYNNKGVQILNGLSRYSGAHECDNAVQVFRKAAKLLNPRINEEGLGLIEMMGSMNPDQVDGLIANAGDELYKTVLKHLAVAARFRKRLRGF